jgi:hydroxymethylpyrimidine/phosphomethylpyrimidine kinase
MRRAARTLQAAGARAVLVKGGHLAAEPTDLLLDDDAERLFASPRVAGPSPRGTGCALATAIAVELARGRGLGDAVDAARGWLVDRIRRARAVDAEWHLGE